MTSSAAARTAYDDLCSPARMHADCEAAGRRLRLPLGEEAVLARAARRPVPSVHFDDFPCEVAKRDIEVGEAAQRLANALHLHLD